MKSVFYLDIRNTYTGSENRNEELIKFVNNLISLDDNDELFVSFVSTDLMDVIKSCMDELTFYIQNTKIKFGNQFSENERLSMDGNTSIVDNGKTIQIYNDLINSNYSKAYYADDTKLNVKIASTVINKKIPNINLITFNPSDGIKDLNDILKQYISNNKNDKHI